MKLCFSILITWEGAKRNSPLKLKINCIAGVLQVQRGGVPPPGAAAGVCGSRDRGAGGGDGCQRHSQHGRRVLW